MPTYVSLINFTDQGIRNIKKSPARLKNSQKLAAKFKIEFKGVYYTVGPYDLVVVLEGPDDEAINAFALAIGSQGNVRTTTMQAYSPEGMAATLKRV